MKTPVDRARLVPAHADEVKTRQLKVHVLIHKHARRRSKLRGAELASRRGSVGGYALRASVCFQRGLDLYEGAGVKRDAAAALACWREAASRGDVDAMYNVGVMYNDGDGIERCVAKALTWFGEAAKRGDAEAAAWCARLRAQSSG